MGDCLCLESILSHVETRQVQNDYTIAWAGKHWQIPRAGLRPGLRGSTIRVEARLAGTLQARIGDGFVQLRECERPARTAQKPKHRSKRYVPGAGESQWMNGFSIKRRQAFDETATSVPQANETACGSEESSPLFPFPQGESRGGRVPPTPHKARLPHKRAAAPLWIPCEHLDDAQQRLGTFYFVGMRNFLFCVDRRESHQPGFTFRGGPPRTGDWRQPRFPGFSRFFTAAPYKLPSVSRVTQNPNNSQTSLIMVSEYLLPVSCVRISPEFSAAPVWLPE